MKSVGTLGGRRRVSSAALLLTPISGLASQARAPLEHLDLIEITRTIDRALVALLPRIVVVGVVAGTSTLTRD